MANLNIFFSRCNECGRKTHANACGVVSTLFVSHERIKSETITCLKIDSVCFSSIFCVLFFSQEKCILWSSVFIVLRCENKNINQGYGATCVKINVKHATVSAHSHNLAALVIDTSFTFEL